MHREWKGERETETERVFREKSLQCRGARCPGKMSSSQLVKRWREMSEQLLRAIINAGERLHIKERAVRVFMGDK